MTDRNAFDDIRSATILKPGDNVLIAVDGRWDMAKLDALTRHLTDRFPEARFTVLSDVDQVIVKPACTCPQIDVTKAWEKPGSVTVPGYDPGCPVCPDPHAPGDRP